MEKEGSSKAKEEYALLCKVPHDLDEETLDTVMTSKSRKLKYSVREVVGKPVGRVQYFLNKTFFQLLQEGKVKSVYGLVFFFVPSYMQFIPLFVG